MHPDRDFDARSPSPEDLAENFQDLALEVLLNVAARRDRYLFDRHVRRFRRGMGKRRRHHPLSTGHPQGLLGDPLDRSAIVRHRQRAIQPRAKLELQPL